MTTATVEWLTAPEFGDLCGVSHSTVCGWLRSGAIPGAHRTPTGRWKVHAESGIRWLADRCTPELSTAGTAG